MKKYLLSILIFTILLLNSCGKKNNPEIKGNDELKIETVEFKCQNMHCSSCEETITKEVKKLDGIKEVSADAKSKIVKVSYYKDKTSKTDIEKTINAAGYDTETSKSENKHNCDME
jgi:copper chaperone CopZ